MSSLRFEDSLKLVVFNLKLKYGETHNLIKPGYVEGKKKDWGNVA